MNRFFLTIIQSLLLFEITKQSNLKQAITTVKAIGKTIKSPFLKQVGNTIKSPIVTKFGNTMKKSLNVFRHNKKTVKNLACGFKEKYLKTAHNFGSKSAKYLGVEGIKKFKYTAPQTTRGSKQLFTAGSKKNILARAATQMRGKELSSVVKSSSGLIKGNEVRSLINMLSKSKPQLPFLAGVGLIRMTEFGLNQYEENKTFDDNKHTYTKQSAEELQPHVEDLQGEPGVGDYCSEGKVFAKKEIDQDFETPETLTYEEYKNMFSKVKLEEGQVRMKDGKIYKGDIVDEEMHGKGRYVDTDGSIYEGDFLNNMPHGKGTQTKKTGEVYVGDFVKGKRHGEGKLTKSHAITYEKIVEDYLHDGNMCRLYYVGLEWYQGSWEDDKFEGQGTYYSDFSKKKYTGNWHQNEKSGYGEYTWPDDSYYKGNWKNNMYHGKGEWYTWTLKKTFNTEWSLGTMLDDKGNPVKISGNIIKIKDYPIEPNRKPEIFTKPMDRTIKYDSVPRLNEAEQIEYDQVKKDASIRIEEEQENEQIKEEENSIDDDDLSQVKQGMRRKEESEISPEAERIQPYETADSFVPGQENADFL